MTASQIAKVLARHPAVVPGRHGGGYVVLPLADYRRLCEAVEDALDLADLERARREDSDGPLIPWASVKAQLDRDRAKRSRNKGSAAKRSKSPRRKGVTLREDRKKHKS